MMCVLKPKFHYADFPMTSATSPQQTRDVPFSPNSITPTSPKLGIMEFGLKGTSRVCRRCHGEIGIVEFGLKVYILNVSCGHMVCISSAILVQSAPEITTPTMLSTQ